MVTGERVLIIEKDHPIRNRLQLACSRCGLEVHKVHSWDAAESHLKRHYHDIIILGFKPEGLRLTPPGITPPAKLTVSIGVASFPVDARSKDALLHKADIALYKAKHRNKNRVCCV